MIRRPSGNLFIAPRAVHSFLNLRNFISSRLKKRSASLRHMPPNWLPMTLVQGSCAPTMRVSLIRALAMDMGNIVVQKPYWKYVHTTCRFSSRTASFSANSAWRAPQKHLRSSMGWLSNRTIRRSPSHSENNFSRGMLSAPNVKLLPACCALTKPGANGRISQIIVEDCRAGVRKPSCRLLSSCLRSCGKKLAQTPSHSKYQQGQL